MAQEKPNILIVLTDQQSANMMSCAGNEWLNTPNMDWIAERGIRFERAYCTWPVCVPSRFSLFTGRMPSEVGITVNAEDGGVQDAIDEVARTGMGWLLKSAGYETVYAGKQHLPRMAAEDVGFRVLTHDERDECATVAAEYLRRPHEEPFCLVASFINPHDICYMAIRESYATDWERRIIDTGTAEVEELDKALQWPEGVDDDEFYRDLCPPLPVNFEPAPDEPEIVKTGFLFKEDSPSPFLGKARMNWDEKKWRLHRWAYARLTERVDGQIGVVLEALRASGLADNTVIVFTTDHGDYDSARRMEHKELLYGTVARVPFVLSCPGETEGGQVDTTTLVSNGLDLIPTVCDYAGVAPPPTMTGTSIRPATQGQDLDRSAIPVQCSLGRGVVSPRFSYSLYESGKNRAQLFDLETDPHEMHNLAEDPQYRQTLVQHHEMLKDWIEKLDDRVGQAIL